MLKHGSLKLTYFHDVYPPSFRTDSFFADRGRTLVYGFTKGSKLRKVNWVSKLQLLWCIGLGMNNIEVTKVALETGKTAVKIMAVVFLVLIVIGALRGLIGV